MQSDIACTIPSPGFGTIRIFSDITAPMPVNISAARSTNSCKQKCGKVFVPFGEKSGILSAKRFINLVNTMLSGICNTSVRIMNLSEFLFAGANTLSLFLLLLMFFTVCMTISIVTNRVYKPRIVLPKLKSFICDML